MSFIDRILAILAPHDCLGCGQEGSLMCENCLEAMPKVARKQIDSEYLGVVYSATAYQGPAKDLIWKLKSSGAQEAARIMAILIHKNTLYSPNCLIVPVPTATGRVRQRGYDQAKLIARELALQARLPYSNCLVRSGQAHQVGAGREQRLQQLNHAFRLKSPLSIKSAHIILVDDVVTTGATLETITHLLMNAGAAKVDAVTFARPKLRTKLQNPRAL